jgi:hypothetical protein
MIACAVMKRRADWRQVAGRKMTQIFTSWNQIAKWLSRLSGLRQAA